MFDLHSKSFWYRKVDQEQDYFHLNHYQIISDLMRAETSQVLELHVYVFNFTEGITLSAQ